MKISLDWKGPSRQVLGSAGYAWFGAVATGSQRSGDAPASAGGATGGRRRHCDIRLHSIMPVDSEDAAAYSGAATPADSGGAAAYDGAAMPRGRRMLFPRCPASSLLHFVRWLWPRRGQGEWRWRIGRIESVSLIILFI